MQASVKWVSDELFLGLSESGHSLLLDASSDSPVAPSPLENVLLSIGSCSSVDVVSILQKSRQDISGCEVKISAERVNTVPRVFSSIHLNFIISGNSISEKHVARAVQLSAEKYCSVAIMLAGKVEILQRVEYQCQLELYEQSIQYRNLRLPTKTS